MKHGRGIRTDATGQEHISQLADGRIRQDALDIVLDQGDRCGEQRGKDSDKSDGCHRRRRQPKQGARAGDHVHARGHHCGRMDQGADRCRTFHRIGQPHVERYLGGFARCPDQHQQTDRGDGSDGSERFDRHVPGHPEHRLEIDAAESPEDEQDREQKTEIPDPVDDECFLAGVGGRPLMKPEPYQEVRTQSAAFPSNEHEEVVVCQNQGQHGEHEQVQVREVPVDARFMLHH